MSAGWWLYTFTVHGSARLLGVGSRPTCMAVWPLAVFTLQRQASPMPVELVRVCSPSAGLGWHLVQEWLVPASKQGTQGLCLICRACWIAGDVLAHLLC
jgi:hypothetical protein